MNHSGAPPSPAQQPPAVGTRLLCADDFEDLIELQAPADATADVDFLTADWAERWPSEHVFKAVKRG